MNTYFIITFYFLSSVLASSLFSQQANMNSSKKLNKEESNSIEDLFFKGKMPFTNLIVKAKQDESRFIGYNVTILLKEITERNLWYPFPPHSSDTLEFKTVLHSYLVPSLVASWQKGPYNAISNSYTKLLISTILKNFYEMYDQYTIELRREIPTLHDFFYDYCYSEKYGSTIVRVDHENHNCENFTREIDTVLKGPYSIPIGAKELFKKWQEECQQRSKSKK